MPLIALLEERELAVAVDLVVRVAAAVMPQLRVVLVLEIEWQQVHEPAEPVAQGLVAVQEGLAVVLVELPEEVLQ